MKWTENGITIEGTPAEYLELRKTTGTAIVEGTIKTTPEDLPKRTHAGKRVEIRDKDNPLEQFEFASIKKAVDFLKGNGAEEVTNQAISAGLIRNSILQIGNWLIRKKEKPSELIATNEEGVTF